jgi:triosephosphate isomerase
VRPTIIAGNWKMFKDLEESNVLIKGILDRLTSTLNSVKVVICPPYTSLALASKMLKESTVGLGAQNMSEHDEGAYTGEISGRMLLSAGCRYVIVGHSERRQYFKESDALINRKALRALELGLVPIICVGETLDQREKGTTHSVVRGQIEGVLKGFSAEQVSTSIIAYEPVWAIGTGKTASPEQAQEVHALIRSVVEKTAGREAADKVVLQYGGSVKPDNAKSLLAQKDIDGALVGGACLKAESFVQIIESAV